MFRSQQHTAQFVPAGEARPYFDQAFEYARFGWEEYPSVDDISVMVLETDQGAIAYSDYFILQPHVATGGTIDGEEVIMTYCGLTNLGIAYSPVIDGQPLELSVMTQLENNLVLWDSNTGQPIQQIWGTMERAEERGRMQEWPTVRMPFSSFEKLYPDGRVYVNNIDAFTENPLTAAFDRLTRHVMMYNGVSLQWVGDDPAFPTIDEFDERLPRKALIYGLNVADDYVAYTKEFIADRGDLINTRIGGRDVVISYDEQFDSVGAFYNDTGARRGRDRRPRHDAGRRQAAADRDTEKRRVLVHLGEFSQRHGREPGLTPSPRSEPVAAGATVPPTHQLAKSRARLGKCVAETSC